MNRIKEPDFEDGSFLHEIKEMQNEEESK